jgi:hypothetical protein
MEKLHLKAPKLDINTIEVDSNSKVGKEQGYTRNVEEYKIYEERNGNGRIMSEYALPRNVAVSSIIL